MIAKEIFLHQIRDVQKKRKTAITIRIPESLACKLRERARATGIKQYHLAETALREWLEREAA